MRFIPLRLIALALLLVACQAAPSCSGSNGIGGGTPIPPLPPANELTFDQDRAWADLAHLVENIGRRRIGTEGAQLTREYIRGELAKLGWIFEEDIFQCEPPVGANRKGTVTGTNLIARWPGTIDREVWLASHYDTFDRPKFVGANDAGSSTAVLIELGRQLALEPGVKREGPGVSLVWFDGEEPFYPVRWNDETNSTFGSRHLAQRAEDEGFDERILALVLLDMVGDKNLGLKLEQLSTNWLKQIFRRTASELEMDWIIVGEQEIKDDHRPFLRKGIPAIDLIDFNYPNVSNLYWHTDKDTLDKCSAESLGIVGRLVLATLPRVAAKGMELRGPNATE
ncbi:MAG: M28 family peptidase [Planctomycetes bacterium]|nr:M28 family peptidase [Planctomycetota bacterium]